MVGCCVKGCTNSFAKGFRMTRIPTEPVKKLSWAIAINRPKFDPKSQYYVCEVHFRRDMWEVTQTGKIVLKKEAVPVLFGSATFTKPMRNRPSRSELNTNDPPVTFADDVSMDAVTDCLPESSLEEQVDKQKVTIIELKEEIRHLREQLREKDSQLAHMEELLEASQECRDYFEEKYYSSRTIIAQMGRNVEIARCCVEGCKSSSDGGFRMFRFPAEPSRKLIWIKNVFGSHRAPNPNDCVCEVHFEDDMWTASSTGKVRLKETAIPTFFVKRQSVQKESQQSVTNGCPITSGGAQLSESVEEKFDRPVINDCTSTSAELGLSSQYLSDEENFFKDVTLDTALDYLVDPGCL